MACYSEKLKVLYIHVPKTGGTTITNILVDIYKFKRVTFENGEYDFIRDIRCRMGFYCYIMLYSNEAKKLDFASYFKFSFVRHPHTRTLSAIKFIFKMKSELCGVVESNILDIYEESKINPFMYIHLIMTQKQSLENFDGVVNFDFIGRYENFIDDLKYVLHDILNLPRRNIQMYHMNKSDDVTMNFEDVKLLSNHLHEDDFTEFGYSVI